MDATLKLASSASDQNVFFTYVCTVNNITPKFDDNNSYPNLEGESEVDQEDEEIQVERSKALHELVDSHKDNKNEKTYNRSGLSTPNPATTSGAYSEASDLEDIRRDRSPNLLKLTKMKWLTEGRDDSPDSSSPCLSPEDSSTSTNCESDEGLGRCISVNDKYLSTIIRLDKEHNMFGLSNITIVGSRPSKKIRKDDRAVFHQTAIVQVCCGSSGCCRHMSRTDLPASLRCGGCRGCCMDSSCIFCSPCPLPCSKPCPAPPPCPSKCVACPKGKCTCKIPCAPSKCMDCISAGLKISVSRKPKYDPPAPELTPRSSCILQKPYAARSCHHLPHCIPPSSCFPYLMPCFWPSRPSAPCSNPDNCFHNPPCRPPRKPRGGPCPEERCPHGKLCTQNESKKCINKNCLGQIAEFKKEFERISKKPAPEPEPSAKGKKGAKRTSSTSSVDSKKDKSRTLSVDSKKEKSRK